MTYGLGQSLSAGHGWEEAGIAIPRLAQFMLALLALAVAYGALLSSAQPRGADLCALLDKRAGPAVEPAARPVQARNANYCS